METKSQRGEVTFDGNQLLLNGKPSFKDFLKQAWAECYLWGYPFRMPHPMGHAELHREIGGLSQNAITSSD